MAKTNSVRKLQQEGSVKNKWRRFDNSGQKASAETKSSRHTTTANKAELLRHDPDLPTAVAMSQRGRFTRRKTIQFWEAPREIKPKNWTEQLMGLKIGMTDLEFWETE